MPTFTYSARNLEGSKVQGSLEAASRKTALQQLAAKKLRPLSISESGTEAKTGKSNIPFAGLFSKQSSEVSSTSLSRKLALPFLQNLKELLNCGIQAGDALRLMSGRLSDPRLKFLSTQLWDELRQGRSLSETFHKQPKVFDESVVSLVEAGEATGSLNTVLTSIVSSMEERKRIQSNLLSALAYPVFLILITIGLVLLFLFLLLPRIQGLLSSLGGKLPVSTKLLIFMADWLLNYGWIVAIGGALAVFGTISWRNSKNGRSKFDALIIRVPLLGKFLRDLQVLRLTQILALLLENGITMVQSLTMTERALTNYSMRERFTEARNKVVEGATLSTAFKSTGYFDEMSLDIFTVGENTGNVVPGLNQMSRQYSESIDKIVKGFMGIISTGVLLFVFLFVGLIAFGIISAVFQLSSSLSGG